MIVLRHQVEFVDPSQKARPLRSNGTAPVPQFWAAGPLDVLSSRLTGLFSSAQCPGSIILKTFDAISELRNSGQVVVGGFHSPMEWECLLILLRGRQPVVWVPARSIVGMRLPSELAPAFTANRLLVLSPFGLGNTRMTADLAEQRNQFVAALADEVLVAHAAPGSKTAALCQKFLKEHRTMKTISDPANQALVDSGAIPV